MDTTLRGGLSTGRTAHKTSFNSPTMEADEELGLDEQGKTQQELRVRCPELTRVCARTRLETRMLLARRSHAHPYTVEGLKVTRRGERHRSVTGP